LLASDVPYANTVKDHRLKSVEVATGLWSRAGKVIHAPAFWLDKLPNIPLDGELWLDRNRFQDLTSIVSKHDPGQEWEDVCYAVFDSPPFTKMMADRNIKVRDYAFEIRDGLNFYNNRYSTIRSVETSWTFEWVYEWLGRQSLGDHVHLMHQHRLVYSQNEAVTQANAHLDSFLSTGAEGVVLRKPESFWQTQRCHTLLKYKPWNDAEATITGFTSGRKTDRGSKLLGMIGALIVDYQGKRLELSGLTDEERRFENQWMVDHAIENPGKEMPLNFIGRYFGIGQVITFKYRELSDDGIPKEARYWRK